MEYRNEHCFPHVKEIEVDKFVPVDKGIWPLFNGAGY